jgi:hypothetical protein
LEWIELKNNFVKTDWLGKQKYSDIPFHELNTCEAHWALMYLLKNGYVQMNAYNEIEVMKLIKCLKVLKIQLTIKQNHFPKDTVQADNEQGIYEFMLENFIYDRK